jgi:hypothetical protein
VVAAASSRTIATDQRGSEGGGAYMIASNVSARRVCSGDGVPVHVEQKMLR